MGFLFLGVFFSFSSFFALAAALETALLCRFLAKKRHFTAVFPRRWRVLAAVFVLFLVKKTSFFTLAAAAKVAFPDHFSGEKHESVGIFPPPAALFPVGFSLIFRWVLVKWRQILLSQWSYVFLSLLSPGANSDAVQRDLVRS